MATGPFGMPIEPVCTEAANRLAEALEQLGHHVAPAEVATVSAELTPAFVFLVESSLGEHVGDVDFEQVEPHIAAQYQNAQSHTAAQYVRTFKDVERLSRDLVAPWGQEFDVLVTPDDGHRPAARRNAHGAQPRQPARNPPRSWWPPWPSPRFPT